MLESLDKTVSIFDYYYKKGDETEIKVNFGINLKNVVIAAAIIVVAKIFINDSKNY